MEVFRLNEAKQRAYKSIFHKDGNVEMRYLIHGMAGEGLGNYFGTSSQKSVPLNLSAIKGAGSRTKSNSVVSNRKRKQQTNKKQVIVHSTHKKGKWPNL